MAVCAIALAYAHPRFTLPLNARRGSTEMSPLGSSKTELAEVGTTSPTTARGPSVNYA